MMERQFLSVKELASYLGLKESLIYSLVENGKIPHYRIGRLIRFKRDDVNHWIEGHRREGAKYDDKRKILKITQKLDVDRLVQKAIDEVRGFSYSDPDGKPDRIKGLGKEGKDGII